jgi:hypothetical protein
LKADDDDDDDDDDGNAEDDNDVDEYFHRASANEALSPVVNDTTKKI